MARHVASVAVGLLLVAMAVDLGACFLTERDTYPDGKPRSSNGGGAPGSTAGSGIGGASGVSSSGSGGAPCHCPKDCTNYKCDNGACVATGAKPVGSECGADGGTGLICNGSGTCVDCLDDTMANACSPGIKCPRCIGVSCGDGSECASGHCADGVCCNEACTARCFACNLTMPGTCDTIGFNKPDDTALCDDGGACTCNNEMACDNSGHCGKAIEQACANGADCIGGKCRHRCANSHTTTCTNPGDCPGSNCVMICVLPPGQSCATDGECASNMCINSLCQ